jgi:hypothetical protein
MADDAMDDDDDQSDDSGSQPQGALSLANTPTTPAAQTYAKQILDKTLAGGDLSGEQAMFKDLSDNTTAAKAALQTARDRLMAMRVSPQQEAWARAQAFLAPTRTGNFGDTLANYAGAQQNIYGQEQALQQKQAAGDLDYSQQQSGLDATLLNAKLKLAEMQQAQQNTLAGKALTTLGRPTAAQSKAQFKTMDVGPGQVQNAWVDPVSQTVTPIGQPFAKAADPGDDAQWTDSALYNAAVRYNMTGNLPSLGMGKTAAGNRKQIMDMAGNLSTNPAWVPPSFANAGANAPSSDTATAAVVRGITAKADASSLNDMTKRTSVADTSEQTALKNLDLAGHYLTGADQSGSPLWNSISNKIRAGVVGDPDVSAYQNALTTARNEYARVISMASGASGLTDAAMAEGQKMFPDNLSPAQFVANKAAAVSEMANRTASLHDAISSLKKGIAGGANPASAAPAPKALPSGDKLTAYAAAHFGGDTTKATAFLKSQGYQ